MTQFLDHFEMITPMSLPQRTDTKHMPLIAANQDDEFTHRLIMRYGEPCAQAILEEIAKADRRCACNSADTQAPSSPSSRVTFITYEAQAIA